MRRAWLIAASLAIGCAKAPAGKSAPALKLDALLQAPSASLAGLPDLKGKVAVVEFWATWCDPCVEEIPHLNSLVEKFSGKPVVFISVTDEPREKVETFLKTHPIKGWVAVDAKDAFAAWGVKGRPQTFVIDAAGSLAGKTYPAFLKAEDIAAVLEGKPLTTFVKDEDEAPAPAGTAGPALFEALLSSSTQTKMYFSSSESGFHGHGLQAGLILAQAFGVNEDRVRLEPEIRGHFDVDVQVPFGQEAKFAPTFQNLALVGFERTLSREKRKTAVLVLTKARLKMKESAGKNGKRGFSTGPGRITAAGMGVAELADALEQWAGDPVVDETGLKGRYDFELNWDIGKEDSLNEALKGQLGLELVKAERPLELLVFKVEKPK